MRKLVGVAARALSVMRPLFGRRREFLIVSSDDTGSCGDQAMTEAIRSVLADRGYDVALLHPTSISHPVELLGPVRLLSQINSDDAPNRFLKFWRRGYFHMFWPNSFGFMGADVVDGAYSERKMTLLLKLFDLAIKSGAKGRVFGASVSKAPSKAVMNSLAGLTELTFNARDPFSQERFDSDCGRKSVLVADTAFNLKPSITSPSGAAAEAWVAAQKAAGRYVLGLNINGHTLARVGENGQEAYNAFLNDWMAADANRAVLLLPHDSRPAPTGDVGAAEDTYRALIGAYPGRVEMLRPPLNAWELKHLTGMVDLIMTGRMHLAIAALGMGTPPLCIAYLNKFEGLFDLFGIEGLVIELDMVADKSTVLAKLDEATARGPALRETIAAKLPEVMALSLKNFEGLGNP